MLEHELNYMILVKEDSGIYLALWIKDLITMHKNGLVLDKLMPVFEFNFWPPETSHDTVNYEVSIEGNLLAEVKGEMVTLYLVSCLGSWLYDDASVTTESCMIGSE
jgi:hypothetical protein